jgi:hypothetical protein
MRSRSTLARAATKSFAGVAVRVAVTQGVPLTGCVENIQVPEQAAERWKLRTRERLRCKQERQLDEAHHPGLLFLHGVDEHGSEITSLRLLGVLLLAVVEEFALVVDWAPPLGERKRRARVMLALSAEETRALRAALTWSLGPLGLAPPVNEQVRHSLALDPAV